MNSGIQVTQIQLEILEAERFIERSKLVLHMDLQLRKLSAENEAMAQKLAEKVKEDVNT